MGPLLASLFVAGVTIGAVWQLDAGIAAAAAVTALTIATAAAPARHGRPVIHALWILTVLAAGLAHGAAARTSALSPPLVTWFDEISAGDTRTLDVVHLDGTLASDAAFADGTVRLMIDVARVRQVDEWHAAAGRVQAHVAGTLAQGHVAAWTGGRRIRVPALLRRPQVWRNFGGPSEVVQHLRRPFDLSATIKSAALAEVAPGLPWDEAAAAVRRLVRDAIGRYVWPRDATAAAIAVAILVGDRTSLDPAIVDRLQAAGTYHVIAISGGNVALLTALCFVGVRALVRSARIGAALTIAAVLAYGWIVGGDPSVARAVGAACLFLTASALGLRPQPLHLLAAIAALLTAIDPLLTVDVGAWLSFAATLGIIIGATRIAALLERRLGVDRWPRRSFAPLGRVLIRSVAATVAAELALLPIVAAVFHRVTIAGVLLNVIAIPAMAVVQCAGLAVVLLQAVAPAASASAAIVAAGASALVDSARVVNLMPWLSWRVPSLPWWWTLAYIVAAATAVWCAGHRVRSMATVIAAGALLIIATAPDAIRGASASGLLRMVMFDVGQGDAVFVQLPSGQTMLVDAGGTPGAFDIGARIVTPGLWAQGISRLEWLVITHPDQDHIGGAIAVAEDLSPREVWEGIAVPRSALRAALREHVRSRGVTWRELRAGDRLEAADVTVDVLHPREPEWERQRVRNDDSVVLRFRYRDVELLLTGDAGIEFESTGAPADGVAPLRVLKAAHHGSRSSSRPQFVEAYAPDIVVISAGRGNLFGHPAPDVLARFRAVGAEVFRTDTDGAITIETDGQTVNARAYGGRTWSASVLRTP